MLLQAKDVVNVIDGTKLGKVVDLEIDQTTGKITSLIIANNTRFLNFFTGNNPVNLRWDQIVKIGGEVIIVNSSTISKS